MWRFLGGVKGKHASASSRMQSASVAFARDSVVNFLGDVQLSTALTHTALCKTC